jgi:hypothetical protein
MMVMQRVQVVTTYELLADCLGRFIPPHHPYSPDLAPIDLHLFAFLKQFLGSNEKQKKVKD